MALVVPWRMYDSGAYHLVQPLLDAAANAPLKEESALFAEAGKAAGSEGDGA
jgi:hypothetical protein